jgi:hypothetical protein
VRVHSDHDVAEAMADYFDEKGAAADDKRPVVRARKK